MTYDPKTTAVLLVDPYNDFLSEGGKTWPRLKAIAEEVSLLDNLRTIVGEARAAGLQIVFVPHRRWEPGDYEDWRHATPYQRAGAQRQIFARGSWGGEFHADFQPREGDIVAKEHWGSSGFANTDLDLRLRQAGVQSVILVGLIANTCIEATGRFAMELGYDVTLVRDATAAFSPDAMHSAHEINGPTYTREILSTAVLIGRLREIPR